VKKSRTKKKSESKPKKVKKLTKAQLKQAMGGAPMGFIISARPALK